MAAEKNKKILKKSVKTTAKKARKKAKVFSSTEIQNVEMIFDSTKPKDVDTLFVSEPEIPQPTPQQPPLEPQKQLQENKPWWKKLFSFDNKFFSILIGLISAGIFCAGVYVFATYGVDEYYPIGNTLNPSCNPGDTYCKVFPAALYSFGSNNFSGTGNFTTTGTGSSGSLVTTVGGLTLLAGQDIRPSADSTAAINIAQADGTDFVTFDTTNKRVGIGVTSPTVALDITGVIKVSSKVQISGTDYAGTSLIPGSTTATYSFQNYLSRATAAPVWSFGPYDASSTLTGGNDILQNYLAIKPTYNQTGTAGGTDLLINRTETAVGSGAQYLIDAQVGGISKFAITNAGNVGIGTTNPSAKLTIAGATGNTTGAHFKASGWNIIHRIGPVGTTGGNFELSNNYDIASSTIDDATYGTSRIFLGNGLIGLSTNTTNTAPTARVLIDSSGNVKIPADSKYLYFGASDDASITFTGTSLDIRSDVVTATDELNLRGGTNGIDFLIGATEQMTLTDGKLAPTTNNDIDLGDSTNKFKNGYFAGKLTVDGEIDPTAIDFTQVATPANPSSGHNKIYFKSDNKLYKLTSGGVETEVGGSSMTYPGAGIAVSTGSAWGTSLAVGTDIQAYDAELAGLSSLSYSSGTPFVKMTAAGTFALDTNTYLTSYTETDTLASVTGRGATTTNAITVGNLQTGANGASGQLTIYSEQGGTDYSLIFQPNAAMTESSTYIWPAAKPASNKVLQSDSSGNLTWVTAGGGGSQTLADTLALGNVTGGNDIAFNTNGDVITDGTYTSIDPYNRKLYASNGSTVQADYSTAYAISMAGAGTPVSYSIFAGQYAGSSATSAYNSNFLGQYAGNGATNAENSNFLGYNAGKDATNAPVSNFLGLRAGESATNAHHSNFLGYYAGYGQQSASYSVFIGSNAGNNYNQTGQTDFANNLIIDQALLGSGYRASASDIRANALLYGTFAAAAVNQQLTINGTLNLGANSPIKDGTNTSIDPYNRQLKDSSGNLVAQWGEGTLRNASGTAYITSSSWVGTATSNLNMGPSIYTITDGTNTSINPGNRTLNNSSGNQQLDWDNAGKIDFLGNGLYMSGGDGSGGGDIYMDQGDIRMPVGSEINDGSYTSIDPYNRKLYASNGATEVFDWSGSGSSAQLRYNSANSRLDFTLGMTIGDTFYTSIDPSYRLLKDSSGNSQIDWDNSGKIDFLTHGLYMNGGSGSGGGDIYMDAGDIRMPVGSEINDGSYTSIDPYNRQLKDLFGNLVAQWSDGTLRNASGTAYITSSSWVGTATSNLNMGLYAITDGTNTSINPGNRTLNNSSGNQQLDWDNSGKIDFLSHGLYMSGGDGSGGGDIYMDAGNIRMPLGSAITDGMYNSIDPYNRTLNNSSGISQLDWDNAGKIDFLSHGLYMDGGDGGGGGDIYMDQGDIRMPVGSEINDGSYTSIDPYNRQLKSSSGNLVAQWGDGTLRNASGTAYLTIGSADLNMNGYYITNGTQPGDSNFLGNNAGYNATSASFSNFLGSSAGQNATFASYSNFLGVSAGYNATNGSYDNFFGHQAGSGVTNAQHSNFLSAYAGYDAANAFGSNFLGYGTGYEATNGSYDNFLGFYAGRNATNAHHSNFFGQYAGYGQTSASYSVFIGSNAGNNNNQTGQTDFANNLIIDQALLNGNPRANAADIRANALLYGTFAASAGSQDLAINASSVSFGSDQSAGTANVAGSIKLFSAGDNAYYTTFTAGTQTANATYTLPTALPDSNKVLQSTSAGVLSWESVSNVWTLDGTNGSLYSSDSSWVPNGSNNQYSIVAGYQAGSGDTSASYSNFLGYQAGNGATFARNSNFFGQSAGYGATGAGYSNFLGLQAGYQATNASYSNFFGLAAGQSATSADYSNFLGNAAGYVATNASYSNFFGKNAGYTASSADYSNFLGYQAGHSATSASNSNFLGQQAGYYATNASFSNFLGFQAGYGQTSADYSVFIGSNAGNNNNQTLKTDFDNNLIIDQALLGSGARTTAAAIRDNALLYGTFASTAGSQELRINAGSIDMAYIPGMSSGATVKTDSNGYLYGDSSSSKFKTNIEGLSDDFNLILQASPKIYTYQPTGLQEVGFIAEDFDALGLNSLVNYDKNDNPTGVKYDRISLYLLEVIKKQQISIQEMRTRLGLSSDNLTVNLAGTVGSGQVSGVTPSSIAESLVSLGVKIVSGVANLTEVIADKITAKTARVNGLEIVDSATGDIYCTWIANGEWQKAKGECNSVLSAESTAGIVTVSNQTPSQTAPGENPVSGLTTEQVEEIAQEVAKEVAQNAAQQASQSAQQAQRAAQQAQQTAKQAQQLAQKAQKDVAQAQEQIQQVQEQIPQSLNIISVSQISDINVAYGTDVSSIGLPQAVSATISDSSIQNLAVTWGSGTPSYNANTPGTYTFSGTLSFSGNITNTSDIKATVNVIVAQDIHAEIGQSIQDAVFQSIQNAVQTTGEIIQDIAPAVSDAAQNAGAALSHSMKKINKWFSSEKSIVNKAGTGLANASSNLYSWATASVQSLGNWFASIFEWFGRIFTFK